MKSNIRKNLLVLGAMAITLWIGGANAAPVYTGVYADMYLKKNTFPNGLMEEKVFLDKDKSIEITGHVGSKKGMPLVKIESPDTLDAKNGFATIKPLKGELLHEITISVPNYWFGDLIFSVLPDKKATTDLVITATDKSGGTESYGAWLGKNDWVNGDNRILVLSVGGNLMESVTIASDSGFKQLKKIEISEVTAVPLPATVWLFGSALLGFMGFSRRSQAVLKQK